MRMWMVPPVFLCNKHLLGEHVECHMFTGCILKRKSLAGYVKNGLIEVHNLRTRHSDLAKEITRRGFKHNSPLPCFAPFVMGEVNVKENINELSRRCTLCRHRILPHKKETT